uniref:Leucine carboxyl methyltransferase 2 n=1 Tax=Pundamilia nyererei TaxID=303518 RepID=A0A3B4GBU8_9CICH
MPATNRKAQKKGRDTAVQGTNDSSVVSKVSAAAQGYFNDVFLQHFVCKVARRAPLINRGYYVRWKAVDHCVRKFLQITEKCPKRQVSCQRIVQSVFLEAGHLDADWRAWSLLMNMRSAGSQRCIFYKSVHY